MMMNGTAAIWNSRKQSSVALSSSEAEFISLADSLREIKWLRNFLLELGLQEKKPTVVFEYNSGAIKWGLSDNRAKHIDIRYHFVKDLVDEKLI